MRKRILFRDEEIAREIERRIGSERMSEGSKLPSERQLAEEFGVQRDTVRCALGLLLNKGVLIRKPRKGYFVAPERIELDINNLQSVNKVIESLGENSRTVILDHKVISMGEKLAGMTLMPEGTLCHQILRLRYEDGVTLSLERSYLIAEYVPGLTHEEIIGGSLPKILKQRFRIVPVNAHQRLTQVYPDEMEAGLLKIAQDEPLVRYEGLLYDRKGRMIEFFDNVIKIDRIKFRIKDFA